MRAKGKGGINKIYLELRESIIERAMIVRPSFDLFAAEVNDPNAAASSSMTCTQGMTDLKAWAQTQEHTHRMRPETRKVETVNAKFM